MDTNRRSFLAAISALLGTLPFVGRFFTPKPPPFPAAKFVNTTFAYSPEAKAMFNSPEHQAMLRKAWAEFTFVAPQDVPSPGEIRVAIHEARERLVEEINEQGDDLLWSQPQNPS